MIYTSTNFTPEPQYETYPKYHIGDYLEDYFRNRFIKESPLTDRDYIAVSWTTIYVDNKRVGFQEFLNNLPRDGKYFTVSQHDDAPMENLPANTLCFSAGGNIIRKNIIPIPLICSSLPTQPEEPKERKLLASFVGSATHPIRISLANVCNGVKNIDLYMRRSMPNITSDELNLFLNKSINSKFCLCPRGYGANSFRIYECMQLGCIPVIITDKTYLPWEDELNWNEFSVIILTEQLFNLENILLSYSEEQIISMRNKIKELYPIYFSMDGVYNNILKRII